MRGVLIKAVWLLLLFVSCQSKPEYIIRVDVEKLNTEYKAAVNAHGLTREESNAFTQRMLDEVYQSTLRKRLPPVQVIDLKGHTKNLVELLTNKTLLVFTFKGCGPGMETILDKFPKTLLELKKENITPDYLCILLQDSTETKISKSMNELITDCQKRYPGKVLLMNENEALKLNIMGSPMGIIVDNGIVQCLDVGNIHSDTLRKYFKKQ